MRWKGGRRSSNIDDRRGRRGVSRGVKGGGLMTVIVVLVAMYFGIDPSIVLQGLSSTQTREMSLPAPAANDQASDFVAVVLADTEDTWSKLFQQMGRQYQEPVLVLFSDSVDSACGYAQAVVGPFYCPADRKVYLDLGFFRDLEVRFQAPGDFAQAYVIAHEIGHHVQTLLGISQKVGEAKAQADEAQANALSVRQELQADCFAGIWANHADKARQLLEHGDIEEGLNAASAIGDDRLQMQSRGYIAPETFTHGRSEQRVRWFKQGLSSGDLRQCNTFTAERL